MNDDNIRGERAASDQAPINNADRPILGFVAETPILAAHGPKRVKKICGHYDILATF